MADALDTTLKLLFPHEHMLRSVDRFSGVFFPHKRMADNLGQLGSAYLAGAARNPALTAPIRALPNVSKKDIEGFGQQMEERVRDPSVRKWVGMLGNPQVQAYRNWKDANLSVSSGLLKNTLVEAGLGLMPGLESEDTRWLADRFNEDVRSPSIRKTGNLVGKYGPDFYVGTKLFRAGEMIARGALVASASRIAARTAPARMAATATPRGAAMAMFNAQPRAAGALLARSAGASGAKLAHRVAAHGADYAGNLNYAMKPLVTRLTEAAGRAAGVGTFTAGYEYLDNTDMDAGTLGSAFVWGAGLSLGIEGVLYLGARAITPWAKRVNLANAHEHERLSEAPAARWQVMSDAQKEVDLAAKKVGAARAGMELQRHTVEQLAEFEAAGFIRQTPKQIKVVKAHGKAVAKTLREEEMMIRRARQSYDALNNTIIQGEIIPASILSNKPHDPRGVLGAIRKAMLNTVQTPEEWGGRLGINFTRIFRKLTENRVYVAQKRATHDTDLAVNMNKLAKAMGVADDQVGNGEFAKDAFYLANEQGIGAVRAQYGDDVARLVQEPLQMMDDMYSIAESMGGQPKLTQEVLKKRFGINGAYLPHITKPLSQGEYRKQIQKALYKTFKREHPDWTHSRIDGQVRKSVGRLMDLRKGGVQRFGSFDHERTVPGSLRQLIDDGMPFEGNPYTLFSRYLDKLETRIADARVVGWNGEHIEFYKSLVGSEGGSEALASNILDTFFGRSYADEYARRLAQNITNLQIAAKLTYAPVPNSMQTVTTTIPFNGIENTARGMRMLLHGIKNPDVIHRIDMHVGHMDGMFQSLRRTAMGGTENLNKMDEFVDWLMKTNGFTTGERLNRMLAGASTYQYLNNTIGKAVAGNIKGETLMRHRRQFAKLDLDFDKVVNLYREGGELVGRDLSRALYLGAEYTQFIPNVMRRPTMWSHPAGRVLMQFNSFVLGQYNFLRNHVFAEAAHGNFGPAATVFSTYPLAGEFVGSTLEVLKGRERPDDPVTRVVENFSLVGGMGIATSVWQSARWGGAQVASIPSGPTGQDVGAIVAGAHQAITTGEGDRIWNWFSRQPSVTFAHRSLIAGAITLDELMEDSNRDSESWQRNPVTLDDLRNQKKARPTQ